MPDRSTTSWGGRARAGDPVFRRPAGETDDEASNPDAPQRPVRLRALREGKHVFVAVPRLRETRCFLHLDPARLGGWLARAATIGGAAALGTPVTPAGLGRIDLVVAGSVAVNRTGARVGKGGGYSDLEYALARQLGSVDAGPPVVTTVHGLQVVGDAIPMTTHDVPIDIVVTPTQVIAGGQSPRGRRDGRVLLAPPPAVARQSVVASTGASTAPSEPPQPDTGEA